MSAQRAEELLGTREGSLTNINDRTSLEGLDDLFKWASEMVSDGEDFRVRAVREHRIRRQVLDTIQRLREQKAVIKATEEVAYLQRRVIALLQKLQDITEENAAIKQTMVAQAYELQRISVLEGEIKQLRLLEFDRAVAQKEQQELLDAISSLKIDRDFLDDLLRTSEDENTRLANILANTRAELASLKSRRWWHMFWRTRTK